MNTKLAALVKLLRPRQAIKSLLILVAPIAAGQILVSENYLNLFVSMAGFTLVSSSIYILNDMQDVSFDRNHPRKKFRPIASGIVNENEAILLFAFTFVLGLIALISVNRNVAVLGVSYVVIQISYVFWLKSIPIVEIFCVSSGFLIRTLVGAAAILVTPSPWLLAIVSSGALMVVVGKRLSEKNGSSVSSSLTRTRPVLEKYASQGLMSILTISAGCTIISYISWTLQPRFNSDLAIMLSAVSFAVSILTYINTVFNDGAEEPERDLSKVQILLPGVLTLVLVILGSSV